jgi:hypothetical protein
MAARAEVRPEEVVFVNLTGGIRTTEITPSSYVTLNKDELLARVA